MQLDTPTISPVLVHSAVPHITCQRKDHCCIIDVLLDLFLNIFERLSGCRRKATTMQIHTYFHYFFFFVCVLKDQKGEPVV